jgi:hypothetical protein
VSGPADEYFSPVRARGRGRGRGRGTRTLEANSGTHLKISVLRKILQRARQGGFL